MKRFVLASLACWLLSQAACTLPFRFSQDVEHALLPPPPPGKAWRLQPRLSDEFGGGALDRGKWLNYHPYWAGREPSRFDTANVAVGDGLLRLRAVPAVDALEQVGDPEKDVWVLSSAVASTEPLASYGYYEARFKASSLSMTSSFWLQGRYSEIDVVEQVGAPRDHPDHAGLMLMNTHYYKDGWENDVATPRRWRMPYASAEAFHVYGAWWRDEDTVVFYHDGVAVDSVKTGGAFDEPMYLFLDTEVFVWEGLPSVESLNDPGRNAMQVDWVRSWTLEDR